MILSSYLKSLPPDKLDQLYSSHWTCLAVLRSLPPMAKQYVLRLLFIQQPLEEKFMQNWVKTEHNSKHTEALMNLRGLQVLREGSDRSGRKTYVLHPGFQQQLQSAVSGRGLVSDDVEQEVLDNAPTSVQLDEYARQQWEAVLLYLNGRKDRLPPLPRYLRGSSLDLDPLLRSAHLRGSDGRISATGFQFLLLPTSQQLWTLLQAYIREAQTKTGLELAPVMSFLLQLGFRRVGQPCALATLEPQEQEIAAHMVQLGLLHPFTVRGHVYFSPTRLAASLCSGAEPSAGADLEVAGAGIITETNYRVYCYTAMAVQISILQLFCRTECILPNLYVGTLTRESVQTALASGISADQIVGYLRQHAHPHVAKKMPVVPEVVSDQVRLWEAETMRMRATPVIFYSAFESTELYRRTVQYAVTLRALVYENQQQQQFAAKQEYQDKLRDFIRKVKEELGHGARQRAH